MEAYIVGLLVIGLVFIFTNLKFSNPKIIQDPLPAIREFRVKPRELKEARDIIRSLDEPLALLLDVLAPLEPCDHNFPKARQSPQNMYENPGSVCIGCGILGIHSRHGWQTIQVVKDRQEDFLRALHSAKGGIVNANSLQAYGK